MIEEDDDTASNPLADTHLPVAGEVESKPGDDAPDINQDMIAGTDSDG